MHWMINLGLFNGLSLFLLWSGGLNTIQQERFGEDECPVTLHITDLSRSLDSAILFLENIQRQGGWKKISLQGRLLQQGDTGKLIRQLRERLNRQGIVLAETEVFDDELLFAIKKFQCLHGLIPDGKVGRETLRELNVGLEERIMNIRSNLSKAKKISTIKNDRLCIINIPAFMLHVFENKKLVMNSKVVVGKLQNRTAEFGAWMNEVVLNPYWDIPESILNKEILPEWRKDPSYIDRNHMEWSGGRLRQRPGPDNALGRIKFIFPNPYNMYMHDTPARYLFEKEIRAFSHGCIRVEKPMELAAFLLRGSEWAEEQQLREVLLKEEEKRIPIKEKVWVELVYLTAFVDEQGDLNFRRDLYQKGVKPLKKAKNQ